MKKLLCILIALFLTAGNLSFTVFATEKDISREDSGKNDGFVSLSQSYICIDGYVPNFPDYEPSRDVSFPDKYDPRTDDGFTMPIKDQIGSGACGAFATTACLEISGYKMTGLKQQFSEEAPRFILSDRLALINNVSPQDTNGKTTYEGFYHNSIAGGWNFRMITSYFSNFNNPIIDGNNIEWKAPILSQNLQYSETSNIPVSYWPDVMETSNSSLYVSGTECVEKDPLRLKEKILEYGAVYTTFESNDSYFNESTGAHYVFGKPIELNHAIAVVGWDDNYPIENFKEGYRPDEDGAWLVKNSYGEDKGDGGYCWISYEDITFDYFELSNAISSVEPLSKNEYILSHDFTSFNNKYEIDEVNHTNFYNSTTVYTCNVYDVSDYSDTYNVINKVMFYANGVGGTYDVYIAPADANGNPPSVASLGTSVASGNVEKDGLMTVHLNSDFPINPNVEKYAIIVKHTDTDQVVPVREDRSNCRPKVNAGESFFSTGGAWSDVYTTLNLSDGGNYCVRPILKRATSITQNSSLSKYTLYNAGTVSVNMNLNGNQLFSIKNGDTILYEDKDFTRDDTLITFTDRFKNKLDTDSYTEITFSFTDGADKKLRIYPKGVSQVNLSGKVAKGQTLTATPICSDGTTPVNYITYQWQSSSNGTIWGNITTANSSTYTLTANDIGKYIRCAVTVSKNNTMLYGTTYSPSTATKVVLYGDVDGDGEVHIFDVNMIRDYLSRVITLTDEQLVAGDVDGSGDVSISDTLYIQQYLANIINVFPVEGNNTNP